MKRIGNSVFLVVVTVLGLVSPSLSHNWLTNMTKTHSGKPTVYRQQSASLNFPVFFNSLAAKCPSFATVIPNPVACDKFITCLNGTAYESECPIGKYFNQTTIKCEYDPSNTKCQTPGKEKKSESIVFKAIKYLWNVIYYQNEIILYQFSIFDVKRKFQLEMIAFQKLLKNWEPVRPYLRGVGNSKRSMQYFCIFSLIFFDFFLKF